MYLTDRQANLCQSFRVCECVCLCVCLDEISYLPTCFAHRGINCSQYSTIYFIFTYCGPLLRSRSLSQWDINSLGSFYTKTALSLVIIGCTNGRISKKLWLRMLCFYKLGWGMRVVTFQHQHWITLQQNKNYYLTTVTDKWLGEQLSRRKSRYKFHSQIQELFNSANWQGQVGE